MNRLAIALLCTSMIMAFPGCGDDDPSGGRDPVIDTTPPTVVSVDPVDGATISTSRAIQITFSEGIRPASLALGGNLATDAYQTNWPTTRELVITPTTAWGVGSGRDLTVDASDTSGNALATHTVSYTVDANVDAIAPAATASPTDAATIAVAQPIVITFSETMATASLVIGGSMAVETSGGAWLTAAFTDDRVTISPTTGWSDGAQTMTIDATDLAGNPLPTLTIGYTVDPAAVVIDAVPPTGVAVPADGGYLSATGVVQITYDEAMDESSVTATGTLAGAAIDTWDINSRILTISTATAWSEGVGTMVVNATDVAGNPANTLDLTLTVDSTLPTASPTPASSSFIAGDVAITIAFSEEIDAGTLSLGGSMASESDGGVWSDVSTLVISPTTAWSTATGATLTVDADDLAGNSLATLNLTYDVDGTPPTVLGVVPDPAALLLFWQAVTIVFSETIDPNTFNAAGTLLAAPHLVTIGQTTTPNDSVMFQPNTSWADGVDQSLVIDVADLAGNALATLSLTFDVGIVHVSVDDPNATDSGGGSRAAPFATLRAAALLVQVSEIHVAVGVYPVDRAQTVMLRPDVKLLGGYAADWTVRDPATYGSEIQLTGTASTGGQAPIWFQAGGTVDGFTIRGGSVAGDSALIVSSFGTAEAVVTNNILYGGSPVYSNSGITGTFLGTIENNTIFATTAGISVTTPFTSTQACTIRNNTVELTTFGPQTGIQFTGSSACSVEYNWIHLNGNDTTVGLAGAISNASSTIRNNVIESLGTSSGIGIDVGNGSTAIIQNNTVLFTDSAVRLASGRPELENNIFVGTSKAGGVCLLEEGFSSQPTVLRNNALFACGDHIYGAYTGGVPFYYDFVCSGQIRVSCPSGTALSAPTTSSNTDLDPMLTGTFELQASSPAAATRGGNTIAEITDDILGTARTTPYSMGAFEYD